MSDLTSKIDPATLPRHIAIIMDGNGRWAKKLGNMRIFGHQNAVKAVRDTIEGAVQVGVPFVTLYAFSTENWNRPKAEVDALMELLVDTMSKERRTLMDNNVRLRSIGFTEDLPAHCRKALEKLEQETSACSGLTLTLALSYGSRRDILEACRKMAESVQAGTLRPNEIDEAIFRSHLTTQFLPDPELLIRTSGEYRVSNFLLWEIAYAELYICDTLWPDFRRQDLYKAILDFQKRERRFGKTSEQISAG